jgi:adhesin transport system membrane fusion protein
MKRLEESFANDVDAALDRHSSRGAGKLLLLLTLALAGGVFWAHTAVLDEVTHADGKVIPSGQIKVVQPLEGGIVSALHVKDGETVEAGAPLVGIDDTGFASSLGEIKQKQQALIARRVRLEAEATGREPDFRAVQAERAIIDAERALYTARMTSLAEEIKVAEQQLA